MIVRGIKVVKLMAESWQLRAETVKSQLLTAKESLIK
jgi:hypothetical protein